MDPLTVGTAVVAGEAIATGTAAVAGEAVVAGTAAVAGEAVAAGTATVVGETVAAGTAAGVGETMAAETIVAQGLLEAESGVLGLEAGLETAAEASELVISEQGLVDQLDAIRFEAMEALAVRNEAAISGLSQSEASGLSQIEASEITYPDFSEHCKFETRISEGQFLESDYHHFKHCNEQLSQAYENGSLDIEQFTDRQLEQIRNGDKPEGYTWHHHEDQGRMQLVDSEIHAKTPHTGGRSIWGGGSEAR